MGRVASGTWARESYARHIGLRRANYGLWQQEQGGF